MDRPNDDELQYLADQQRYALDNLNEEDYGAIREAMVILWALTQALERN